MATSPTQKRPPSQVARTEKPNVTASRYQRPRVPQKNRTTFFRSALILGALTFLALLPLFHGRDRITVTGLVDGMTITKADLLTKPITIQLNADKGAKSGEASDVQCTSAKSPSQLCKVVLRINGQAARVIDEGEQLRWVPPDLVDAPHVLTIQSGKRFLWRGPTKKTIRFVLDSKAPVLTVNPIPPLKPSDPFVVSGTVDEPVTLTVDGAKVAVKDKAFTVEFKYPPIGGIRVVAVDRAGTITRITVPSSVQSVPIRGVLATAQGWTDPARKSALLKMIDEGRINAVVLDLKNDAGHLTYKSKIALAKGLGATDSLFDLRGAVNELHARGVRVLGRVVMFRDPLFANAQWAKGARGDVAQSLDGSMVNDSPGPWLNPAAVEPVAYLSSIVRETAELGVDVVLLDGVERPPGRLKEFVFAGIAQPGDSASGAPDDGVDNTDATVDTAATTSSTSPLPTPAPFPTVASVTDVEPASTTSVATATSTTPRPLDADALDIATCSSADPYEDAVQILLYHLGVKLRGTPARLAVVVNGSAARNPKQYGQNVKCLAGAVDFIAPTLMPSEFKNRAFAVIEPAAHPKEMVSRSLSSFRRTLGRDVAKTNVIPWLQDYSKGRRFGVPQVRAQIDAVKELSVQSFLLWDPNMNYSAQALDVDEEQRKRLEKLKADSSPPTVVTTSTTTRVATSTVRTSAG
jgi:hypothetical protein